MARRTKTGQEYNIYDGYLRFGFDTQAKLGTPLFEEIIEDKYVKSIRLISLATAWQQTTWIDLDVKIIENINFEMTLRKEKRGNLNHWYAYRRVCGTLYKRYVGTSENVTIERLLYIAQHMPSL